MTFRFSHTHNDKVAATEHRIIRAQWFRKYLTPEQINSGDLDGKDEDSVHIFARDEHNEIVGISRVTLSSCPTWYIEQFCTLPDLGFPREHMADVSRHGISPQFATRLTESTAIHLGLIREVMIACHEHGVSLMISGVKEPFFRRLNDVVRPYNIACVAIDGAILNSMKGTYYEGYVARDPRPVVLIKVDVPLFYTVLTKAESIP
jgi:hypothetical protein